MPAERDDPEQQGETEQIDELVDEFGDRGGPAAEREPELELGDDEVIVEPAAADDEDEK